MNDISSSPALLFEISGVLYSLLLAYYAFSLERVMGAVRENSKRLVGWRAHEHDPKQVNLTWDDLTSFAGGVNDVYRRRTVLAVLFSASSVVFLLLVLIAGLLLVGVVPKEPGELALSSGSYVFLVGVPTLFAFAGGFEARHSIQQKNETWTRIKEIAEILRPQDTAGLQALLLKWRRKG